MKLPAASILLLAAALGAAAARAERVPDEAACEKARPRVEQLTADDYEALRMGNKTRIALARDLRDYATQPDIDPAAKYLLLRASFKQLVQSGDTAEIRSAYGRLRRMYGPEYAVSIVRFAKTHLQKFVATKKDGAKELYAYLSEESRRLRAVESLRAHLEQADTSDAGEMRRRLAAAYAVLGDWARAADEYARYGGDAAAAVAFERDYPRTGLTRKTSADVAEFWWGEAEIAGDDAAAAQVFRARAAVWYRRAVANGVLCGVDRQIAEKRAAEGGAGGETEAAP